MKSLFTIILTTTSLITFSANGQIAIGARAGLILESLIQKEVSQVGELNLKKLKTEIEHVQWERSDVAGAYLDVRGRRSAHYNTAEKKVTIRRQNADATTEQISLLELHEAMGALGYRDQNYSQSSSLYHLNKVEDSEAREKLVKAYGEVTFNKKNLNRASQGGSSVGGGGDLTGLIIKSRVLNEIMRTENPNSDFFVNFAEIVFEPREGAALANAKHQEMIGFLYELQSKNARGTPGSLESGRLDLGFQERLTVSFSPIPWNAGEEPQKIVDVVKQRILELYAASAKTPLISVLAKGCSTEQSLGYPSTDDTRLKLIQQYRAGFQLGCIVPENKKFRFWTDWYFR